MKSTKTVQRYNQIKEIFDTLLKSHGLSGSFEMGYTPITGECVVYLKNEDGEVIDCATFIGFEKLKKADFEKVVVDTFYEMFSDVNLVRASIKQILEL